MALKYTITNKMISSIVSISEKIGRIKEIRQTHKHIDFDLMCNVTNVQDILNLESIDYPEQAIVDFLNHKLPEQADLEDFRFKTIYETIAIYANIKKYKPNNLKTFLKIASVFTNYELDIDGLKTAINILRNKEKVFIVRIAEFCNLTYNYNPDNYLIQIWLTILFYNEIGCILYLPYAKTLEREYSLHKLGEYYDDVLAAKCKKANSLHPSIEFYLSIIDSILIQSLELDYKLSKPILGRVEMLKGKIKEPFCRKDYLTYYDISGSAASKDLKDAVDKGILIIEGDKINARYWYRGDY